MGVDTAYHTNYYTDFNSIKERATCMYIHALGLYDYSRFIHAHAHTNDVTATAMQVCHTIRFELHMYSSQGRIPYSSNTLLLS